ncbi:MAG: BlaI/MecI/CopY family transcriptional regulator [Candidatus Micrarchaeota archaeon]
MLSKGVLDDLSPLEAQVINVFINGGKMKVRDIYSIISKKQKVVLTSIAVMLDRLYEKKLVDREIETCRGGTRYIYFLRTTPEQIEEDHMKKHVDTLISKFGDKALSYFHKRFSEVKK